MLVVCIYFLLIVGLLYHSTICLPRSFAYPGVRDNRSTLNTKTGYDIMQWELSVFWTCWPAWGRQFSVIPRQ